jgi:hypothetical protein
VEKEKKERKKRRKLPRCALEQLMEMCEWISQQSGKPAGELLKRYLDLMDKYDYYFFSEPWPEKYDYARATTFTDEDKEFLAENKEEFGDRHTTVCLKKNISLEGFVGHGGMTWTRQAYHEQFFRPELKPVSDAFFKLAESSEDAREILDKLKAEFESVSIIHLCLVDRLEYEYLRPPLDLLMARVLELIHTQEGLPVCDEYLCRLQREKLQKK